MARTSKLLYDPDCSFCKVTAASCLIWDIGGELRPMALGTPEADRLLAEVPEEDRMAPWHLVEPSGEVSSAGAGFAPLLRGLLGAGSSHSWPGLSLTRPSSHIASWATTAPRSAA